MKKRWIGIALAVGGWMERHSRLTLGSVWTISIIFQAAAQILQPSPTAWGRAITVIVIVLLAFQAGTFFGRLRYYHFWKSIEQKMLADKVSPPEAIALLFGLKEPPIPPPPPPVVH